MSPLKHGKPAQLKVGGGLRVFVLVDINMVMCYIVPHKEVW